MPFHPVKPIRGGKPLDSFYLKLAADVKTWMCQAKINGQRTLWSPDCNAPGGGKGVLWSRRELVITRAPDIRDAMRTAATVVDGELVLTGEPTFYLFDLPNHPGTLTERWSALLEVVAAINHPRIVICPSEVTWEDVNCHAWEGVVFKKRVSRYPKALSSDNTTPTWIKYRAEWL